MNESNIIDEILKAAYELSKHKGRAIIAIDGRCASGKTTFASILSKELKCNVIHIDDFYLASDKRTAERMSLPGGNIDYERFLSEVLLPLEIGEPFSFCAYDCCNGCYKEPIEIIPSEITIVEGAYSCLPVLKRHYDLTIFMDVDVDLQYSRILKRNGKTRAEAFKNKWIPLEEKYFLCYDVLSESDFYIRNNQGIMFNLE